MKIMQLREFIITFNYIALHYLQNKYISDMIN